MGEIMKKLILETKRYVFAENEFFPSCHASTVLPLGNGDILTACFGGTYEKHDDVVIYARRITDTKTYAPIRICAIENTPHWNPVLHRHHNGRIVLYFKVGKEITSWRTYFCESFDNGRSFSEPRELIPESTEGSRGPVKNKPITLSDGAIAAPSSSETETTWSAFADLSYDDGKTWEMHNLPGYIMNAHIENGMKTQETNGVIQPTLWQDADGELHMLLRSTWGYIYRSDSSDNGKTWCDAYEIDMPNNNSGIDLDRTEDGIIALVMNPVCGNWSERTPLVIKLSEDNGETFYDAYTLESEPGEFSYPAVVAVGDTLHVTYTWNRKNIVYARLRIE